MGIFKKKLPELDLRSTLSVADLFHINSSALDYKTTASSIKNLILGTASAKLVKFDYRVYTGASFGSTSSIPFIISKPTITQGRQVMSKTYNVVSTSNVLIVEVLVNMSTDGSATHLSASLFNSADSSPSTSINAASSYVTTASTMNQVKMSEIISPAGASSMTFTVRVGASSGTPNVVMNGIPFASTIFLGAMKSYIHIYEVSLT